MIGRAVLVRRARDRLLPPVLSYPSSRVSIRSWTPDDRHTCARNDGVRAVRSASRQPRSWFLALQSGGGPMAYFGAIGSSALHRGPSPPHYPCLGCAQSQSRTRRPGSCVRRGARDAGGDARRRRSAGPSRLFVSSLVRMAALNTALYRTCRRRGMVESLLLRKPASAAREAFVRPSVVSRTRVDGHVGRASPHSDPLC